MTDRTTELREKLTERGVEFATDDSAASKVTMWTTQNGGWIFDCDYMEPLNEKPGTIDAKTELMIFGYTPEQAIAVTLGTEYHGYEQAAIEAWESIKAWNTRAANGTLTAEQVREAIKKHAEDDSCYIFEVYGEMCGPIADELNTTLGSGMCELVETDSYSDANEVIHVLECSECGKTCEHVNGGYPRCPHCGKAVKR